VRFRRHGSLLLVAAAAAGLAGCSDGGSPLALGGEHHAHNSADAAFVRSMSAHEKGAAGITRLAQRRAHRVELRRIARTMTSEEGANVRELDRLGSGLAAGAARAPGSAAANLERVRDATSFDYEFMRTMIEQNRIAIAIARREVRSGSDPDLGRLAGEIASSRQKELDQLYTWLHLWYGTIQPGPGPPAPHGAPGGPNAPPPRI
jgi:uncharacterized protein (DUF305 family)